MNNVINAAPMTYYRGIQDDSTQQLVNEPEVLPTHLPKIYIYAKKGPLTPQLVSGDSMTSMYGSDSFDIRKQWATHATVLASKINAAGNAIMMQRVKPLDANPEANIRIWLDVLETQINEYQRDSSGKYALDVDGNKIPTGQKVAGIRAKWVAEQISPNDSFGTASSKNGDQVDGAVQSTRYPVIDTAVPYFGSDGNNNGLRMWALTNDSTNQIDGRIVQNEKVYPFQMACAYRADDMSTATIVETLSGEQSVQVCFKPNTIDRNTDVQLYIGDQFIQSYQDLSSTTSPPTYGPFGTLHVYDNYVATILGKVYANEVAYIDEYSDITGAGADIEKYMMNIISGVSTANVPYQTFELIGTGANTFIPTSNSTVYAKGGSDGTMNETLFASLVSTEVQAYADENSVLMDTAMYPESIIYDSGFPLATKYELAKFIAVRKDTFVVLSTHDVLGQPLTAAEESSLAIALKTRLQLYPESEFYGTSTARGAVVGRSGKLLNSQYTKRLPLTIEFAAKAAAYMGAGNGKWKSPSKMDVTPNNQVDMFSDVNITFTPANVRYKDWDNGLIWVQKYSRSKLFFPAFKTIYDNDTSVLNSFITAMCCVELEKVGDRAWRELTGRSDLTDAQLCERVNEYVINNTQGRFDDRFVIKPNAYISAADAARGYSWTLVIDMYAPNMKTVQQLSIRARRMSALTQ